MPFFDISGPSIKTGRTRSNRYAAKTIELAAEKARKAGIDPKIIEPIAAWAFLARVAGFSHANSDGSSRQAIICRLSPPESVALVYERGNPHDKHAIAVLRGSGEMLGYVPEYLAKDVVDQWYDAEGGCLYRATVVCIDPTHDGKFLFPSIVVSVAHALASPDAVARHLNRPLDHEVPKDLDISPTQRMTEREYPRRLKGASAKGKQKAEPGCAVLLTVLAAAVGAFLLF